MKTIFAQCSGQGKSGVAIYRISGPSSILVLEKLIGSTISSMLPRTMYLRKIFNPDSKAQIDESVVVYFNSNSSFTGEESVEIHTHGSISVMKLLMRCLILMDDLRIAEPGEFAKRAFLNGKFDLTSAEGLADLIDSETEEQHKQAIRQLGGGLEKIYIDWRRQLLEIMSLLEAYIDFPDEDIPSGIISNMIDSVSNLRHEIDLHLKDDNRGERLRNGLKLAIVGKPNVGKSSLMNYLLKREASIVSSIAGTTRDIIEGHLDIAGYPIIIQDTAGIRENSFDQVEQIGIKKAKEVLENSDIKIIVYDASVNDKDIDPFVNFTNSSTTIIVFNKFDRSLIPIDQYKNALCISVKTGKNLDQLIKDIARIAKQVADPSDNPQITRERHRIQLSQAFEALGTFDPTNNLVLAAEDIRMTIRYLSNITGAISVDEILGKIFSNFCIGK